MMRTNILFPGDWREPIRKTFQRGELVRFVRQSVKRELRRNGHCGLSEPNRPGSPVQDSLLATLVLRHHVTLDELSTLTGVSRDKLSDMLCQREPIPGNVMAALQSIKQDIDDS